MNELLTRLSMIRLDITFDKLVRESFFLGPTLEMLGKVSQKLAGMKVFGSLLQQLSLLIVILLYMVIGLPQFAADKEGLALISLAASGLYLAGRLLGGEGRRATCVDAAVAAYLAASFIACASSHYLAESMRGLAKVVVYVISYFLLTALFSKERKNIVLVVGAALFAGLLVSLYGLYQYKIGVAPLATWEDPNVESKGTRIYSTLGNPNLLAGYLLPLAPLSFGLGAALLTLKSKWRWLFALPIFGLSGLISLAIFLTGSRGGWLAIAATAVFIVCAFSIYLLSSRKSLIVPGLIFTLVLSALLFGAVHYLMPSFEQRLLSIFAGSEHSSNAYRMNVWRAAMAMFKDNWWLGVGTGNTAFRLAYGLYMKSGFDALGTYCVPLEVGVETGILGLISAGAVLLLTFSRAHLIFWDAKRAGESFYRFLALGAAAGLMGLMVHGLVDTVFYRPQVHLIFWLLISLLVGLSSQNEE